MIDLDKMLYRDIDPVDAKIADWDNIKKVEEVSDFFNKILKEILHITEISFQISKEKNHDKQK